MKCTTYYLYTSGESCEGKPAGDYQSINLRRPFYYQCEDEHLFYRSCQPKTCRELLYLCTSVFNLYEFPNSPRKGRQMSTKASFV